MGKRRTLPPPRDVTVADAVSEALGEVSSLAEEMRNWADALEEKFSATEKYSRVNDCADLLEGVSEPDCPAELSDVEVTVQDPLPNPRASRADRLGTACDMLSACVDRLGEIYDDESQPHGKREAAGVLRDDVEDIKSELESADFPGMYG